MLDRNLVLGTVRSVFHRFWNPRRDANLGTTTLTTDVAINTLGENEGLWESIYLVSSQWSPVPLDSQQVSTLAGAEMLVFGTLI